MYIAVIKPLLVVLTFCSASAYFFFQTRKLYLLMAAAKSPGPSIQEIPKRLLNFLIEVIWQRSVRRDKFTVGLAHTFIFWGFLIITIGTVEMVIEGCFGINLGILSINLYGAYLWMADFAIVGVLLGVVFGFYRRLILRPPHLKNSLDAKLILVFTAMLMLTLLGFNVFRIISYPQSVLNEYFIFSSFFAQGLMELSSMQAFIGLEFFYWTHLLMVFGFLAYIPNSKHLHILTAAPNVFFQRLELAKPLPKTNFEDESVESYGLGNISELSWKNILDVYSCTECGRCEEACPATITGKSLSPMKIIRDLKEELLENASIILKKGEKALPAIVGIGREISPEVLWACTSCRACETNCPVKIEQLNPIFELRRNLVQMKSEFPSELQTVFKNLENNFAPWAFPHDTRADWCADLGVQQMADHPKASVLYYVGCAGSFDDRAKKVATAIVKLLQMAGVDFAILGKEEKCNGDPARRAGNEYLAQMLIQENVKTLRKYQPRTILAACPHCFNTLKNEYPAFGAQYNVVHHSAFLLDLVKQGKIPTKNQDTTVTYHDSCYMGRWNGVYEAPRDLLKAAGVKIEEVKRNRKSGLCCGAGGARIFMEETTGKRINVERTQELLATKTKTVALNCPFCTTMITDGIKTEEQQETVVVKDIAEILLEGASSQRDL